ncbi:MAG: hypothetical protein DRG58_06085 [Deltaproteobacteria bacterium]|nr:MAG: hypothetical protein DRG58_06085 [Deltaproteobacteria bacterium]
MQTCATSFFMIKQRNSLGVDKGRDRVGFSLPLFAFHDKYICLNSHALVVQAGACLASYPGNSRGGGNKPEE